MHDLIQREAAKVPIIPDQLRNAASDWTSELQKVQYVAHADVIGMAKRVAQHCEHEGKLRNVKLYLNAARTMLSTVDTLCRVAEQLHDVQRIEQMHVAIFEEIRAESPECAQRIFERMQRLNATWSV